MINQAHISLAHPTGNPNVRQAALALSEIGYLHEIITTIAYNQEGIVSQTLQFLPEKLRHYLNKEFQRRSWISPPGTSMRTHPWREFTRLILAKSGIQEKLGLDYFGSVNWLYYTFDQHIASNHLNGLDAIYAYEDGAATSFEVAKQKGILCLYDLPIPFYRFNREIQAQEAQSFPDLASALPATQEPTWKLERKEKEIVLADHIFVASSITKRSLLKVGIKEEKVSVIPYGAPTEYFYPQSKPDQIFRALFVGSLTPRKGIHYLLQAWQKLKLPQSELLLVGSNPLPKNWFAPYENLVRYVSCVPHYSLKTYYNSASVFVFPSLVEGFGLVLLEAMACGIPIITTPNTGGPDVITNGVEGFIIPIRDVEALQEKLEWCYKHPQELAEMGKAARKKAEQLTWKRYRCELSSKVLSLL